MTYPSPADSLTKRGLLFVFLILLLQTQKLYNRFVPIDLELELLGLLSSPDVRDGEVEPNFLACSGMEFQ